MPARDLRKVLRIRVRYEEERGKHQWNRKKGKNDG